VNDALHGFWMAATLRAGHTAGVVALGCALLGAAAGVVGALALLRRRTLMGDALAHATLPGVAGAFLVASALAAGIMPGLDPKSLPVLLLGAAAGGVLGVLSVQGLTRWSAGRVHQDAAIGVVLSVFFGLGTVLLTVVQKLPTGNRAGLKTFIYGQPAAMSVQDAWLLGGVAVLAVAVALALYKELRLLCFDEGFARVQGWPAGALDLVLMGLVVLVTVVGLQAVGLILVVALLIAPAAGARFWTDRLDATLGLGAAFGAVSGYAGACVSAAAPNLPAGAVIVLAATGLFALSAVAAPRHGVAARVVREMRLRRRIGLDHALRGAYELAEGEGGEGGAIGSVDEAGLAWALRGQGGGGGVGGLVRRGYLRREGGGRAAFTEAGLAAARAAVRNHRLWERYLITHADVAPTHVDRSADMIEHALSPELVRELERALEAEGGLPESPHPIRGSHAGGAAGRGAGEQGSRGAGA
jgi:manganese/zinc/iron transport system permease protein